MNINRNTLKHILANIAVFFTFFSIYTFIAPRSAASLLLAIPFFALMLTRYKVHNISMFCVLHTCAILIPTLIVHLQTGSLDATASVAAFCFISAIYSFLARANAEWVPRADRAIVGIIIINAALLYLSGYFGEDRAIYFTGATLAIIVCAILYTHIDNLDARLKALQDQNPRFVGDILRGNNNIISLFAGTVALIGFFVFFLPLDELGRMILRALNWIGALIARFNQTVFPEAFLDPAAPPIFAENGDVGNFLNEPVEATRSYLWQMLGTFFTNAALVLLVGVIVFLLAYGFRKSFYFKRHKASTNIELSTDTDEISSLSQPLLRDIFRSLPRPKNFIKHPVRRAYIKKVNTHIKNGVTITHSDTPEVISSKIRPSENINDLTASYEKVRYGLEHSK